MVIVKDIDMFSLCEHHLVPFFGKVDVSFYSERSCGLLRLSSLCDLWPLLLLSTLRRFTSATSPTKKWWDWASWQGNTTQLPAVHCRLCASGVSAGWPDSSVVSVLWPGGLESEPAGHHPVPSSSTVTETRPSPLSFLWESSVIITASFVSLSPSWQSQPETAAAESRCLLAVVASCSTRSANSARRMIRRWRVCRARRQRLSTD